MLYVVFECIPSNNDEGSFWDDYSSQTRLVGVYDTEDAALSASTDYVMSVYGPDPGIDGGWSEIEVPSRFIVPVELNVGVSSKFWQSYLPESTERW